MRGIKEANSADERGKKEMEKKGSLIKFDTLFPNLKSLPLE
jgi:hypothetical protein